MRNLCIFLMLTCLFIEALGQNEQDTIMEITLPELVFTESLIKHKPKSDVFKITENHRKGVTNVFDIMNLLPGVKFDQLKSKISVKNDERVLVVVDGQERNYDYIKAIDPKRVKEIEIIHQLPGRYVIAGYKYVIDIKLKNDYVGNGLSINNFTIVSPTRIPTRNGTSTPVMSMAISDGTTRFPTVRSIQVCPICPARNTLRTIPMTTTATIPMWQISDWTGKYLAIRRYRYARSISTTMAVTQHCTTTRVISQS